jgi:membrane fusion protein (multidrug efflux system)
MNKILLGLMSLCALLLYTSCESQKEREEEEVTFLVTSPIKMDTSIIKNYVCQIHAIRHIELRALERGYLQSTYVDEGQKVNEGQAMFQIMPMLYEAETRKAQAEADFALIEYKNTKRLADSSIVAPNELALAKAKLDKALAELSLAQVHLGFTKISAPFGGIMDRLQVRQGSLLDEGELLTTLSDNSTMWVYFNVPEYEYLEYKANEVKDSLMKVNLLMANNKLFSEAGYVRAIEADFNNETGNIAFRATFPNPKGLLRHGETGNIQMIVPFKNALIIPQKASFEILEKKYVFVVDKENIVHQREIVVAGELPDLYVIQAGLKEDEKILLEGIRKVKNNDKIEFEYKDPREVLDTLEVYVE